MFKRAASLIFFGVLMAGVCCDALAAENNASLNFIARIPLQHNGRIKPFEAFARETTRLITDKEIWQGKSALVFVLDILADPNKALETACIRLDYPPLKNLLRLSLEKKYFSYDELKPVFPAIESLVKNAGQKRDKNIHLTPLEQKAEILYSRLVTLEGLISSESITAIPSSMQASWMSPYLTELPASVAFKDIILAYKTGHSQQVISGTQEWIKNVRSLSQEYSALKVNMEIVYYHLKPFQWAWMFYLLGFVLLTVFSKSPRLWTIASGIILAGFLLHTAGLFLRIFILSRPPVSNMYESMVFMNWILMACALLVFAAKKKHFLLTTAAVVSALVMIYADLLPIDQSLDVLVPVLRSNFWLTIHVMTIVSSYGIFGFAMALGHRHLVFDVMKRFSPQTEGMSIQVIFRLLQAGIITLGIGTVLGGVWANESWGRFWGWDPKETWAFITFLGYLIVIHLRATGKLSNFALAVSSLLGFLLVLMTWYGVNFILGKGLHSYGSGSGGVLWVVYYLIFEILFVGWILFLALRRV